VVWGPPPPGGGWGGRADSANLPIGPSHPTLSPRPAGGEGKYDA